jgi:hypothetical protein
VKKVLVYTFSRLFFSINATLKRYYENYGFDVINWDETKQIPKCDFLLAMNVPEPNEYELYKQQIENACKERFLITITRIPNYLKKEFGEGEEYKPFYKLFSGCYCLVQKTSSQSQKIEKILEIPTIPADLNFYDFTDTESVPLKKRNNNIIYWGRFLGMKGFNGIVQEREILSSYYDLVVYGCNMFTKSKKSGDFNFMFSDLGKFSNYPKNRHLKPHMQGWESPTYDEKMYELNGIPFEHRVLNICPVFEIKKLENVIRYSRFALFPYMYKAKRPQTGMLEQNPEYALLEAINLNIPVITTNAYAKQYLFCGKNIDLRDIFICVDDFSEVYDKCAAYTKNYDKNVIHQKAFFKNFYDNDEIFKYMLSQRKTTKKAGFTF